MSVRVMSMVFERYPNGGGEMLLALALADHAHDDGTSVRPSVARLAEKTRQSARSVQYQLRRMEASGWLIPVANVKGGRNTPTEYRISPDWIKGENISSFCETERVQSTTQKGATDDIKGATDDIKGATAIAPEPSEPSRTISEPSVLSAPTAEDLFERFWSTYPRKTARPKAESAFRAAKITEPVLFAIEQNISARLMAGDWRLDAKEFIPHPATYLNQRRWQDEVIPRNQQGDSNGYKKSAAERAHDAAMRVITGEGSGRSLALDHDGSTVR